MVPTFAALDCGTLSTRLLVEDGEGRGLVRMSKITGLGEGVDGSGRLQPAAVARVLAVLGDYREVMDQHFVTAATMIGTSALRDAGNRADFSRRAEEVTGTPLRLLDGQDEASLSYRGATAALPADSGPWLVADIGGGSTELVAGPHPGEAVSLDLGCVRVTERFLHDDPPTRTQLAQARSWLQARFDDAVRAAPCLAGAGSLVGLAGTVLSLACMAQGLSGYESRAVHHYRLSRDVVVALLGELAGEPAADRARRPGVENARAPFIVGGTLVLGECLVSEKDILDGLVAELRGAGGLPLVVRRASGGGRGQPGGGAPGAAPVADG
jgi:exopolyphosphatase/guanosine-5'-triphosphate,3'-diphosphate pyrophosphatase